MMNFLDYRGPMGPVSSGGINAALRLMGLGMLGIFLVMLLICAVVVVLNRVTKKNKTGAKKSEDAGFENKGN